MNQKIFELTIGQNEMSAWLWFTSSKEVATEKIEQSLVDAGVVFGADTFLIKDIAKAHQTKHWYQIAQALPPQDGLEYYFLRHQACAPKRLQDGRVDFYNLGRIQNVMKGDVLVAKVPPDRRTPGKTVTGVVIPPCQEAVPLPVPGHNVALSENGSDLVALISGYPNLIDDCVHVDVAYTLDGDVDFSTGNIDCIGDLLITGDIKFGFHIKCAQNVTVFGIVDGAAIDAGGNIVLQGNVFGQHKSYIKGGKCVRGRYVDAATIEAQNDIILTNGSRRSFMKSIGSIEVQGASGFIIGGTAQASERIVTHDLGCENEIPTRVEVLPGLSDDITLHRFLHQLGEILRADRTWIDAQMQRDVQAESLVQISGAVKQSQLALSQLMDYFARYRQVMSTQHWPSNGVIVTGTVYPGVTVTIGNATFIVSEPMVNVMFYLFDNMIHVCSLDQMDAFVSGWSS